LLAIAPLCHVPAQDASVPPRDRWGRWRGRVYHRLPPPPAIPAVWHAAWSSRC